MLFHFYKWISILQVRWKSKWKNGKGKIKNESPVVGLEVRQIGFEAFENDDASSESSDKSKSSQS